MPKFLIEIPHSEEEYECALAVQYFLNSGSHFLAHADWGCGDGEHKAWIILEAENKEQARWVVPPSFRPEAKVITLSQFTIDEVDEIIANHQN
jgi:hypothetical protein